ncbi:MAG: methionyl-tRNA formyltransferase [Patescibacteria group bacterium]
MSITDKQEHSKNPIRVIFMGTPDFALPGLHALADTPDFEIVGVFTQPDKPAGRGQIMTPPPIKMLSEKLSTKAGENNKNSWPIYQPVKIKTETETIKALVPDLIVVIAYGQIIPPAILDIPRFGCINVHASLLPKYRGAACLNAPILNGDTTTGVTIMKMDAGLDTGPILRQAKINLNGRETLEELHDHLAAKGAEILIPTLRDFTAGRIKPQRQDNKAATYVRTLKKSDGRIDWTKPAKEIERLIRAYNPWPGAYTEWDGKIIKIITAAPETLLKNSRPAGTFFRHQGKLAISCGQDSLVILKLQAAGKKAMTAAEFLNGYKIK